MTIKIIKIDTRRQRLFLLLGGVVVIFITVLMIKWCLGNSIALQAPFPEVAKFAVILAPNDPQTHFALATLAEKTFLPEALTEAVAEYERAAALSPSDYRLWMTLGIARERSGDAPGAELALRRALALAPHYSRAKWVLGNFLLRQGSTAEAFQQIRQAVEADSVYAQPAALAAWQIFDGDLAQILQNIGDSPQVKAALTDYLAKQEKFTEAFEIWNTLSADNKISQYKQQSSDLYSQLVTGKRFRLALAVQSQINPQGEKDFSFEKITNGGFEIDIRKDNASVFEWQLGSGLHPQIGFDKSQKSGGERSLVLIFNSSTGKESRSLNQTVVIEQGRTYALEFSYKSDLKTQTTPKWEVADAADRKILAASEPLLPRTDWTRVRITFAPAETTEAVIVNFTRDGCQSPICPIAGKIWFDDFSISKTS